MDLKKNAVIDVYLFDWGDTLMVDFPGVVGKMCDWDQVEAVDGAHEALSHLSEIAKIYIATGAADSSEPDIRKAFERVGLHRYISGYFCEANVGAAKGSTRFLPAIIERLNTPIERIAMVGDSLVKDIEPAIDAGIKPIWLTKALQTRIPSDTAVISNLRELISGNFFS